MTESTRVLWVLTRLRLRLLLRSGLRRYTRDARSAAPIRLIVLAFVAFWIVVSLVVPLTFAMSRAYSGPNGLAQFRSTAIVSGSTIMLLVFFYAVLTLVNALTGSGDLRLLLLAPIAPRLILGFRILGVSLGFSPILLFGVPGLLAAGEALHFGPVYVVTIFALILIVPVAPVGLAALLVLAVLRWLPPARARTVATTLGVVLGAGLFIATQLLFGPGRTLRGTVPTVTLPAWLPTTWPGRGLVALGAGQAGDAILYLGGVLLLAAALYGIAVELAARLLATGGTSYAEVGRRHRAARRQTAVRVEPAGRFAGRIPWLPVLHKDWLIFRRDPQRLASLIYPVLLVGFYLYRLIGLHTIFGNPEASSPLFLSGALYAILIFSIVILTGPLAASIVNREAHSLYLLALAPLPVRDLLVAKWAFIVAPVVVVVEAILAFGAASLGIDTGQAILAGVVILSVSLGLSGTALTINVLWPRFESTNPRRQGSGTAGLVSFVADLGIGGISCVLFIVALSFGPTHPLIGTVLTLLIFFLTGGCAILSLLVGTRVLTNLLTGDRRPL